MNDPISLYLFLYVFERDVVERLEILEVFIEKEKERRSSRGFIS